MKNLTKLSLAAFLIALFISCSSNKVTPSERQAILNAEQTETNAVIDSTDAK